MALVSLLSIAKLVWMLGTASILAPLFWLVAIVAGVVTGLIVIEQVSFWRIRREHERAAR